jgi:hypothetical protein
MKISEMTTADRDDYICRQSAAVLRAAGYKMPEQAALDYLFEIDEVPSYRFDVLQCVFNCISYTLEHKRNDTAIKEAYENMLIECDAKNVDRLTDELFKIAEDSSQDLLTPIIRE